MGLGEFWDWMIWLGIPIYFLFFIYLFVYLFIYLF